MNEEELIKGTQAPHIIVTDPKDIVPYFLDEFLNGKTYITNNKTAVISSLFHEYESIKNELL